MRHAPLVSLVVLLLAFTARPALASWSPDSIAGGTLLCNDALDQTNPVSVGDGSGGLYVAWVDHRGAFGAQTDIYAQHISVGGQLLWGPGGKAVCTAIGNQDQVAISFSGNPDEVVIAWRDFRFAAPPLNESDIYAQKLDANGNVLWTADGVAVCTAAGNQETPTVLGSFVAWADYRIDGDIYVQVIDAGGTVGWTNGFPICTSPGPQRAPVMAYPTVAGAGPWFAWEDVDQQLVYALAVDPAFAPRAAWDAGGDAVNPLAANAESQPFLMGDPITHSAPGKMVCWIEGNSVMGTVLDPDAPPGLVGPASTICSGNWAKASPRLAALGSFSATPLVVAEWIDFRNGHANLYAQAVDASLVRKWAPATGVPVAAGAITVGAAAIAPEQYASSLVLAWMQKSDSAGASPDYKLYAQRLHSTGNAMWKAGGRQLPGTSASPALAIGGGVSDFLDPMATLIAWQDSRSGGYDVYAEQVDALGRIGSRGPTLVSVTDVPNDDGGSVLVTFNAPHDSIPGVRPTRYHVTALSGGDPGYSIPDVPVTSATTYSQTILTRTRSNAITVNVTAYYTGAGGIVTPWPSDPMTGNSLDNLPPPRPSSGNAIYTPASTQVNWDQVFSLDLAGYRLYRGATSTFPTDAAHLRFSGMAVSYNDVGAPPSFYRVLTFDAAGNQSSSLLITPTGTTDADGAAPPLVFSVANVSPNPLARSGRVEFGLPRRASVRMALVDPAGRIVRDWNLGALPAGAHSRALELRDATGGPLASGIYFLKVSIPGEERTRRLVVLR